MSTLTQDFHTRLDNLLRTLVHAKPHFIRCISTNATETPAVFDRATVIKQIRALQVGGELVRTVVKQIRALQVGAELVRNVIKQITALQVGAEPVRHVIKQISALQVWRSLYAMSSSRSGHCRWGRA